MRKIHLTKKVLVKALRDNRYNVTKAAAALSISRKTFYAKCVPYALIDTTDKDFKPSKTGRKA